MFDLADLLADGIAWYYEEFHSPGDMKLIPKSSVTKLCGPHEALLLSAKLHAAHVDWEFDRYSSIGFYLHDRRGSWMRLWRLAQLYENRPEAYRRLVIAALRGDSSSHA